MDASSGANDCVTAPTVFSTNIRSLFNKIDHLRACVSTFSDVNVVTITESWLHYNIDDNLIQLPGFNVFRRDRPGIFRRGGAFALG